MAVPKPQPETPFLADAVAALGGRFAQMDALAVLRHAASELLPGQLAIVSSFGADSAVLLHLAAQVDPGLPVCFLDTGKHFAETLDYVETLRRALGLTNVRVLRPDPSDIARFDPDGTLWSTDPDSCCHIRKTEPLDAEMAGFAGWVTGRKRFQTSERGALSHFELSDDGKVKVNPLAYWGEADVVRYRREHGLPEHPLYQRGFRSIGCAPCTSAVAEGEDPRAGRWRGTGKTECGIHIELGGPIAHAVQMTESNLFKDGAFVADPFRSWGECDDPATARYTHVPLGVFLSNRAAVLANPHPLGLLVEPADKVEEVADDLDRFASIAIRFPVFTDGRGYSSARLLSERYDYTGEIRAIGDVLADQIPLMWRCGITALVVTNAPTRQALERGALAAVDVFYQPVGRSEIPLGTRPFLRRAGRTV